MVCELDMPVRYRADDMAESAYYGQYGPCEVSWVVPETAKGGLRVAAPLLVCLLRFGSFKPADPASPPRREEAVMLKSLRFNA